MNKKYIGLAFFFLVIPRAQAIVFIQGMTQVWGLSVQNKSEIPLFIVDQVYYPQHIKVMTDIVNPGNYYRSKWVTAAVGRDYKSEQTRNFSWVLSNEPPLGRVVFIWGNCRGTVGTTNMISIGNVQGVTYQAIPSGTYTVITPPNGTRCDIALSNPIDTKFVQ